MPQFVIKKVSEEISEKEIIIVQELFGIHPEPFLVWQPHFTWVEYIVGIKSVFDVFKKCQLIFIESDIHKRCFAGTDAMFTAECTTHVYYKLEDLLYGLVSIVKLFGITAVYHHVHVNVSISRMPKTRYIKAVFFAYGIDAL